MCIIIIDKMDQIETYRNKKRPFGSPREVSNGH